MAKEWHDINSPGLWRKPKGEPKAQSQAEVAEEPIQNKEPEVRLSDPEFLPGPDGFQYNKECILQCKLEFLTETIRKRVLFDLFVEYKGEVENLQHQVEGFPDEDGVVRARAKLFYGNQFYRDYQEDPRLKCQYKFIARHSRGEHELESGLLEMPDKMTGKPFRVQLGIDPNDPETQDDKITLYSTDSEKTYSQMKAVADDTEPKDDLLDLEFTGVVQGLEYNLEIEHCAGGEKYHIFENLLIDGREQQ